MLLVCPTCREGVPVRPGVRETPAAPRGRAARAILTSCRRDHFELMHESTGLLAHFDFVLAGGDGGAGRASG